MNEDIFQNTHIPARWSALIDLREVTDFNIDQNGMKEIVQQDRKLLKRFNFEKLAFVSNHDVVFGMMRMYQSMSDFDDIEVTVLREIEEAKLFLGMNEQLCEIADTL